MMFQTYSLPTQIRPRNNLDMVGFVGLVQSRLPIFSWVHTEDTIYSLYRSHR